LKEHVREWTVYFVVENIKQVKTHAEEISGRFKKLEKYFKDENTT
jgi:hypothetical protein